MSAGSLARGVVSRLSRHWPRKTYFALNGLDRRMEKYLDYDGGYFVELGANDGVDQSNTLYFERARGWTGLLVEPTPHNFFKCKANRSAKNAFHCAACVSFDYRGEFVKILYANLMTTAVGLSSDIDDSAAHAREGVRFLPRGEEIVAFGAIARPLGDLLVESKAPNVIDFLSLDVEGAELEVLRGIDHDHFRFKYMLIECRDIAKMQHYLRSVDYEMIEKIAGHDYVFRSVRAGEGTA